MDTPRLTPAYRCNERIVGTVNGRTCVVATPGDFLTADEARALGLVPDEEKKAAVRTADVPAPRAAKRKRSAPAPADTDKAADSE